MTGEPLQPLMLELPPGSISRRRVCHFDDTPLSTPVEMPTKSGGGGCNRMTDLPTGRLHCEFRPPHAALRRRPEARGTDAMGTALCIPLCRRACSAQSVGGAGAAALGRTTRGSARQAFGGCGGGTRGRHAAVAAQCCCDGDQTKYIMYMLLPSNKPVNRNPRLNASERNRNKSRQ